MGNRAIIIPHAPTEGKPVAGIYVHWNGGIESVLAFCEVCNQRGYRDTIDDDEYAMARLCGVIHEFFGINNGTSVGICVVTKEKWDEAKEDKYTYDNGVYCLGEGWTVAERRGGFCGTKTKLEELDEDERKKYEAIVKHILSGKLVHEGEDEDEEE